MRKRHREPTEEETLETMDLGLFQEPPDGIIAGRRFWRIEAMREESL